MIELDTSISQGAKIRVIGIGGGGGNAINSMINRGLSGVDFIAANTDMQALSNNLAPIKVQVGTDSTRGLGAGADPSVGSAAIQESGDEIREALSGSDMIFLTAGMGGGTGTGGAPVLAQIGKEQGALVVAIVTKPFQWEGGKRSNVADAGIEELRKHVDALIVIPNQKLMTIIDKHTSFKDAFQKVDNVLHDATRGIADIISGHGYINVDFADVRTIMSGTGDALMGTGTAQGEHRAVEAAQNAISSPLLDGVSIKGARGVLVNITGSSDMTMFEIGEAISVIENAAGSDVNLIHGIVFDEDLDDKMMITVVATGFRRETNGKAVVKANGRRQEQAVEQTQVEQPVQAASEAATQQMPAAASAGSPRTVYSYDGNGQAKSKVRTIPVNSPSGVQELQKYDEPAYQRRNPGGAIRINNGGYTPANSAAASRESGEEQSDQERPVTREKPAFLRKIMD